jgi:hypothetical protein
VRRLRARHPDPAHRAAVTAPRQAPVTAEDAARIYQVPIAHIYKLAHRHQWRRVRYAGRVHYHAEDVDAILGQDG